MNLNELGAMFYTMSGKQVPLNLQLWLYLPGNHSSSYTEGLLKGLPIKVSGGKSADLSNSLGKTGTQEVLNQTSR